MANSTAISDEPEIRGPIQIFCDPLDLQNPWFSILYIVGDIYVFSCLHLIVHRWFAVAIEMIVELTEMNEDIAGATLMAIGTSLPELLSGCIGVFVEGAGNAGLGTVVGSLVFNLLVITGGCIAVFPQDVMPLSPAATVRDLTFQTLTIAALVWAFWDKQADIENVILFLGLYALYAIACWKSPALLRCCCGEEAAQDGKNDYVELGPSHGQSPAGAAPEAREEAPETGETIHGSLDPYIKVDATVGAVEDKPAGHEHEPTIACPPVCTFFSAVTWVLSLPLVVVKILCMLTIPDCTSPTWKKCIKVGLVLCLTMSILWIGLLVLFMIEWAIKAGKLIGISNSVMGLTFCAAGTSVPDLFCSLVVARHGKADMAISNVFGSNVFDILIALAVPWALRYSIRGYNPRIKMNAEGFDNAVLILVVILVFYVCCVVIFRCKLPRWVGYLHLAGYGLFLLFVACQSLKLLLFTETS